MLKQLKARKMPVNRTDTPLFAARIVGQFLRGKFNTGAFNLHRFRFYHLEDFTADVLDCFSFILVVVQHRESDRDRHSRILQAVLNSDGHRRNHICMQ
jgi:hypothetical protein